MQLHEVETVKPEPQSIDMETGTQWYLCLKGTESLPFEYAGHSLKKGDQIKSDLPVCGKGIDLTKSYEVKDEKGKVIFMHPPAFEPVKEMVEAGSEEPALQKDVDPRSKKDIAEDIFLAVGEKISPAQLARIGRPDLLAMEQKYIFERDKDGGQAAVMDEKVM